MFTLVLVVVKFDRDIDCSLSLYPSSFCSWSCIFTCVVVVPRPGVVSSVAVFAFASA